LLNGEGKPFDPKVTGGTVLAYPVEGEFCVITRLARTWKIKASGKPAWKVKDEEPPHTYWDLPAVGANG
jgi:hypothetical protein